MLQLQKIIQFTRNHVEIDFHDKYSPFEKQTN